MGPRVDSYYQGVFHKENELKYELMVDEKMKRLGYKNGGPLELRPQTLMYYSYVKSTEKMRRGSHCLANWELLLRPKFREQNYFYRAPAVESVQPLMM